MSEGQKSNITSIVIAASVLSIIVIGSISALFASSMFNFGDESGIFPIISSPDTARAIFTEGDPVMITVNCLKVVNGQIDSESLEDPTFENELLFRWTFKHVDWHDFVKLKEERALSEITIASLQPGEYIFRVEVTGIDEEYTIIDPMDYLMVSRSYLPDGRTVFNEMLVEIEPIYKISTWITNPKHYTQYCEGEEISFKSISKRNFNYTSYSEIVDRQVVVMNEADCFIAADEFNYLVKNQLPVGIDIEDVVRSDDYLSPYGENQYLSTQSDYFWYDQWVDSQGINHPMTKIGEGTDFTTDSLDNGFHTITFVVQDTELGVTTKDTINLWVLEKGQPTVPFMVPFLDSVEVDGSIFADWDPAKSTNPRGSISYYELQIANRTNDFHSGLTEPYVEGEDFIRVATQGSYYIFENLESSMDSSQFEDCKYWFRVRAIDNFLKASYWSIPQGCGIDQPPVNIYAEGIFYSNGTRADQYNSDYSVSYNGLVDEYEYQYMTPYLENYTDYSSPSEVFDLYPGHFEDDANNSYYENVTLTENVVYQYQNFELRLKPKNTSIQIDPDSSENDLELLLFSSIDGLIFKSTTFGTNVSYQYDIAPYLSLTSQTEYPYLSAGIHAITPVIVDSANVGYQLPSLLLDIREIRPTWPSDPLKNIESLFYDYTGDGFVDWGRFGLTWDYPQFNPYMPDYNLDKPTEWERQADKVAFFEIEVMHQYGNKTFSWAFFQESKQNFHNWMNVEGFHDDTISPYELTTGNWSFRIRVIDRDYLISDWSDLCVMYNDNGEMLPVPYNQSLPIMLRQDNPPPNPIISVEDYYLTKEDELEVRVNEWFMLTAEESTDLNGDQISYTWYFDGNIIPATGDYDPHDEIITIYPEWIGNDINPGKDEVDLLDGDDYGDYGLHTITLEVFDGVTAVNTTINITILPVNCIPEFTSAKMVGYRISDLNEKYIFDYESVLVFPKGLNHLDHPMEEQDVRIILNIFNKETSSLVYSSMKIIPRIIFQESGPMLSDDLLRLYGGLRVSLSAGEYTIVITTTDGIDSFERSTGLIVVLKHSPDNMKIEPFDMNGDLIPCNSTGYFVFPNQRINFALNWEDDQNDEKIHMVLKDVPNGIIYEGLGKRNVDTLKQNFYFESLGLHLVNLYLKDPYGGMSQISINLYILFVMILPENNANTVEAAISPDNQHPDYWTHERSIKDVPEYLYSIGDGKPGSPSSYKRNHHATLAPVTYRNAQWLRVWFQMQTLGTKYSEDYLTFKDANDNTLWKIRLKGDINDYKKMVYEYQDSNGNWYPLPKMNLLDTKDDVSSSNTDYSISINKQLVSVVIPGDTIKIEWKTGDYSFILNMITKSGALFGYRIAYVEYLGSTEPEVLLPTEVPVEDIIEVTKGCKLIENLIRRAWNYLVEHFTDPENEFEFSIAVSIEATGEQLKINALKDVTFTLEICYNFITCDLGIQLEAEWETEDSPMVKKVLKFFRMDKIVLKGGIFVGFNLGDGIRLTALYGYISVTLVKEISLIDLVTIINAGAGQALEKADDIIKKKTGKNIIPNIVTIELGIQITFGWMEEKGLFVEVMPFFEISLGIQRNEDDIFKVYAYCQLLIGLSQKQGFYATFFAGAGAEFKLTSKNLLGTKWFNITFLKMGWKIEWEFPIVE